MGETDRARQAVESMTDRLVRHEDALRREAHEDGRDRRPRSAEELHRVAESTARRHDRRQDG